MTSMQKNSTVLVPESITVSTRENSYVFSMFMSSSETHNLMTQLANIAIRQLLDREAFKEDQTLPKSLSSSSGKQKNRKKRKARFDYLFALYFAVCLFAYAQNANAPERSVENSKFAASFRGIITRPVSAFTTFW